MNGGEVSSEPVPKLGAFVWGEWSEDHGVPVSYGEVRLGSGMEFRLATLVNQSRGRVLVRTGPFPFRGSGEEVACETLWWGEGSRVSRPPRERFLDFDVD